MILVPTKETEFGQKRLFWSCAKIYAHLFWRTFATELLTVGNSLETVAALLGHSSTKVTEKSYKHWVKGRQDKLEGAVKNSWAQLGTVDAPSVHSR